MPFKSKSQEAACFATHGFNGKVNCKEWAAITDQKSLPNKKQDGGKVKLSFNPNLALKDKAFQQWYLQNTIEGKNNIPYSDNLDYDYYSYYRNGDYKNYQGGHFPDTYKRPNHETFSNESIYSIPENPGGQWQDDKFIPYQQQNGGTMKNKKKKYQFAGQTNPCGQGTQWDEQSLQCVPIPHNPNADPVFKQDYSGTPTNFRQQATTNGSGQINPSQVLPLTDDGYFNANAGAFTHGSRPATFIQQQNVIGDAIDQNYNYDSDGKYRKNVNTYDNNIRDYNDTFKKVNLGLDILQGFGNVFTDANTKRNERLNLQKARYSTAVYNPYEQGVNQGGAYQVGGRAPITVNDKNDPRYKAYNDSLNVYNSSQIALKNNTPDKKVTQLEPKKDIINNPYTNYNNVLLYKKPVQYQPANNQRLTEIPKGENPNDYQVKNSVNPATGNMDWSYVKKQNSLMKTVGNIPTQNNTQLNAGSVLPVNSPQITPTNYRFNYPDQQNKMQSIYFNTQEEYNNALQSAGSANPLMGNSNYLGSQQQGDQYSSLFKTAPTLQRGGLVNTTGYTPGTPTFNNPMNVIPSGNITMKNTPFPVMAHPDNAAPMLMQPGQDYNFKGAKYVAEVPMKNGGGIHIKKSHEGDFTDYKKRTGQTTEEALHSKDPHVRAMANFAKNAKKWHHQMGGDVPEVEGVGPGEGNAELEQGEVFQTQQGGIQKVSEQDNTHEQGGSEQSNVSRVLEDTSDKRTDPDSKALRVTPTMAKQIVGFTPKSTMTHSKLYEKASEKYDSKLKTVETKINNNLDYIKQNGGIYAKNSLEQNLNLLQNAMTKGHIFDAIYNHQEQVKQMNGITNGDSQESKNGGRIIYDFGGDPGDLPVDPYAGGKTKKGRYTPTGLDNTFAFTGGLPAYQQAWQTAGLNLNGYKTNADAQGAVYDYLLKNNPDVIRNMWKQYGNTAAGIKQGLPSTFDDNYLKDPQNLQKLKSAYADNLFGARTLVPQQSEHNFTTPDSTTQYQTPNSIHASKFNVPLQGYDLAGNIDNYLSSSERIPVSFEQLQRQPLKAHLLNPQPALNANQGDFDAALATLPNNGVGYANQANLLANKYKVNNQTVGQYADQNQQIQSRTDELNNNNKYQLDATNLGIRNTAVEQQLKGMEVERQSKLNAFDDYLTKIAQNRQLNTNGNLVLQMTPFFDQNGQFNGNKYIFQDKGDGSANIIDRKTGKLIETITTDGYGVPKQTKTYVRG